MPTKKRRKQSRPMSAARRVRKAMSREAQAAYGEIQLGVKHLERSIAEIQHGLRQAEQKIEADARARIRELRKDSLAQLSVLKSKQREAARTLKSLGAVAGESWQTIKLSADSILADARTTAGSVVERFRDALRG